VRIVSRVAREVTLEIMSDQVHLFVKAHQFGCSPRIAGQFKGCITRRLRAKSLDLRSRLSAPWPWLYFATTVGAASVATVRRYIGPQTERPWRKVRLP
jgi:REP element-mobilizing transposase RayT